MIIADTSALLALFHRPEPAHEGVRQVIEDSDDTLVVSPYVVAELDYLVATRSGVAAELAVLAELAGGAYELAQLSAEEIADAARVIDRYRDQEIGLADASLVVLARRFGTRTILTLDHRHFEVLRPLDGGRFKLLPG